MPQHRLAPASPRATPVAACPEQPDELELLLAALRFRRWRGCLVTLLERYDGWGARQHPGRGVDAALAPDDGPLADLIAVLHTFPAQLAGQDKALARAILACPFLVRAAQDAHSGEPWEPLEQSFRDFGAQRAVRLVLMPDIPWPEQDFIDWTLEHLQCNRAFGSGARP